MTRRPRGARFRDEVAAELDKDAGRRLQVLAIQAAAPNCVPCRGLGLVCEEHMDRPWETGRPGDCLCGAAGTPCPCTGIGAPRRR